MATSDSQAGAELELQMSLQPHEDTDQAADEHTEQVADEIAGVTKWLEEFRPENELKEKRKLEDWIRDSAEDNIRQRSFRVASMGAIATMSLLLVNFFSRHAVVDSSEIQLIQMFGIILGTIYTAIFIQFFAIWCHAYFWDDYGLFRVYTLNGKPTSSALCPALFVPCTCCQTGSRCRSRTEPCCSRTRPSAVSRR